MKRIKERQATESMLTIFQTSKEKQIDICNKKLLIPLYFFLQFPPVLGKCHSN